MKMKILLENLMFFAQNIDLGYMLELTEMVLTHSYYNLCFEHDVRKTQKNFHQVKTFTILLLKIDDFDICLKIALIDRIT